MAKVTIENLISNFTGEVIQPGDASYESARKAYGRPEGKPALVVRPTDVKDVAAAIAYAKTASLTLSVRSGGHSAFSSNDGGLVIDLSALDDVEVTDEDARTVRIGAGATWGQVAAALQPLGLGISSGDTKSVGVGGLTLYGGFGWMVRGHGLALDNLVAVELVTAGGKALRCSQDEDPDLFWAVRGGGGNFGVATAFEFTAHQAGQVYAGSVVYANQDLPDILRVWRDSMRQSDEAFNSTVLVMPAFGPEAPSMVTILFCYAADDEAAANRAIEPFLKVGSVTAHTVTRKPYADVLEEAHPPAGIIPVVKNMMVHDLSDELLQTVTESYTDPKSSMLMIRATAGALNRVAADATAFAHRDSEALVVVAGFVPAGAGDAAIKAAIAPWQRLKPFASGAYANFFSTIDDEDMARIYPEATYDRLAEAKRKYDPQNLFNQNCNIKP